MNGLFIDLFLSNLQYLLNLFITYFCLLKSLLKGNEYFEGIEHRLENWRVDTKVFLFMIYLFHC